MASLQHYYFSRFHLCFVFVCVNVMPEGLLVCVCVTYLIFVIFLHRHYFGLIILHTEARKLQKLILRQKSVNSQKKSNFATKQCKMQQDTINWTHNEGDFKFIHICHAKKFKIKPHVEKFQISPHDRCIEIWNFSTWPIFHHRHRRCVGDKYQVWCSTVNTYSDHIYDGFKFNESRNF